MASSYFSPSPFISVCHTLHTYTFLIHAAGSRPIPKVAPADQKQ